MLGINLFGEELSSRRIIIVFHFTHQTPQELTGESILRPAHGCPVLVLRKGIITLQVAKATITLDGLCTRKRCELRLSGEGANVVHAKQSASEFLAILQLQIDSFQRLTSYVLRGNRYKIDGAVSTTIHNITERRACAAKRIGCREAGTENLISSAAKRKDKVINFDIEVVDADRQ